MDYAIVRDPNGAGWAIWACNEKTKARSIIKMFDTKPEALAFLEGVLYVQ